MKLQADNTNGVYKVEDFDGEILSQEDFYDALRNNPPSWIICAEVDKGMAAKIEAEYGIHDLHPRPALVVEEFVKDGYRYIPEESAAVHKEHGRIWSRWQVLRGAGSGNAFDGRVFVPANEQSQTGIISRFNDD